MSIHPVSFLPFFSRILLVTLTVSQKTGNSLLYHSQTLLQVSTKTTPLSFSLGPVNHHQLYPVWPVISDFNISQRLLNPWPALKDCRLLYLTHLPALFPSLVLSFLPPSPDPFCHLCLSFAVFLSLLFFSPAGF